MTRAPPTTLTIFIWVRPVFCVWEDVSYQPYRTSSGHTGHCPAITEVKHVEIR